MNRIQSGFVPTSMTIILLLAWAPASAFCPPFMPAAARANQSAFAIGAEAGRSPDGMWISTPSLGITATPASGLPFESPQDGRRTQPPFCNAPAICAHNGLASGTDGASIPLNCCPEYGLTASVMCASCASVNNRGAFSLSSSSCACLASRFAIAAPSWALAVSASFAEIRSLENCSFADPIAATPIVPMRTATAPAINSTFDIEKRNSADGSVTSNISTFTVFGVGLVALLGLTAITIAICLAVQRIPPSFGGFSTLSVARAGGVSQSLAHPLNGGGTP